MALHVNQFCCGCTLRTGVVLIASYYMMVSAVMIAFSCANLYVTTNATINITSQVAEFNITSANNTIMHHSHRQVHPMFMFGLMACLCYFFMNLLLIVGVKMDIMRILYLWIVTHVVFLALTVIGFFTSLFVSLVDPNQQMSSVGSSLVNIVLTFYFIVVVSSYYQEMRVRILGPIAVIHGPVIPVQAPLSSMPSGQESAPPVVVYIEDRRDPPPPYSAK